MSYCKVLILGRLGKNIPELRFTKGGTAVAEFSVATDRVVNNEKKTEWHDVVVFGKTAEACKQYLAKGSQVFVDGTLQTDRWEDRTGIRTKTKVIAERVRFCGSAHGQSTAPAHSNDEYEPGADL